FDKEVAKPSSTSAPADTEKKDDQKQS
ncbi:MAG: hypothetical protein RLZZ408_1534, partial [Verrucomicrobiota bacterium]